MEPTDLTCPNCGATWKLIKAGDGPITCPKCHAVVGPAPGAAESPPAQPQPAPPVASPDPVAATPPVALTPRPAADDADDPGIGTPSFGRMPDLTPPRRGRHPLVTVAVVLLLIFLVPVALCSVLFAVCSLAFR